MTELRTSVTRSESAKRDLEGKLSTVCGILREVRAASTAATVSPRPPTPTRARRTASPYTRAGLGLGGSYLDATGGSGGGAGMASDAAALARDLDLDSVRGDMKDVVTKLGMAEKEK